LKFILQEGPGQFFFSKSAHQLHCIYVRRRYRSLSNDPHLKEKDVYECLNSLGFEDPCPIIPTTSPAIKGIWNVGVNVQRIFHLE
jgi:hypothetical protein